MNSLILRHRHTIAYCTLLLLIMVSVVISVQTENQQLQRLQEVSLTNCQRVNALSAKLFALFASDRHRRHGETPAEYRARIRALDQFAEPFRPIRCTEETTR